MSLATIPNRLPEWFTLLIAASMVGLIGWFDFATGWELSLFVLYAFPILIVVVSGGPWSAAFITLLCGLIWWLANLNDNPYHTSWGYPVAALSRLFYFSSVAIAGFAVKDRREADKERIEMLERTRELEKEIIRVSEHEQRRLGQDLHDGICQEIAAIGFAAAMLNKKLAVGSRPEAEDALEIEELLKKTASNTRDLARSIFPVQMEEEGIEAALKDLVETMNSVQDVDFSFRSTGEVRLGNPSVAMHLYRMAQEAVHNALRHGKPDWVEVRLDGSEDGLKLSILDNGSGFSKTWPSNGMGLKTMQYRAREIGAEFNYGNLAEGGAEVSCTLSKHALPRRNQEYEDTIRH